MYVFHGFLSSFPEMMFYTFFHAPFLFLSSEKKKKQAEEDEVHDGITCSGSGVLVHRGDDDWAASWAGGTPMVVQWNNQLAAIPMYLAPVA